MRIKEIFLKLRLKVCSVMNKLDMPINKHSLIDSKSVRHVYKVEKENIRLFYCMIKGKSYLINHSKELEHWFSLSDIEIKRSNTIHFNFNVISITNMIDYEHYLEESKKKQKAS